MLRLALHRSTRARSTRAELGDDPVCHVPRSPGHRWA